MPNISADSPRSLFIVRAAYPIFTRSRYAMTDVKNRGSTIFMYAFRFALAATAEFFMC